MTKSNTPTGKIALTLFALVFAIGFSVGGVMAGVLPLYQHVSGWWKAGSYVPVSARVLSAQLETTGGKVTTYRAVAAFAYQYQGSSYTSHRVTLSDDGDKIDTYQEDIYQQLRRAQDAAAAVTLWVNPLQPEQAVYDRTIHWNMVLFLIFFAVLFSAVVMGAWWALWRIWRAKDAQGAFALVPDAGPPAQPSPGSQLIEGNWTKLRGLFHFCVFWNAGTWLLLIFTFTNFKAPWFALVMVALGPAIGLWLIAFSWMTMRYFRRIGRPMLALSAQGVLGSFPLQGEILFNPAFATRIDSAETTHAVTVSLECIRELGIEDATSVTVWHGDALQAQVARGTTRLKFEIDLPETLPESWLPASRATREYWQVVLKALGGEVTYIVPVQATRASSPSVSTQA